MDNEDRIERACEWIETLASDEYNQGVGRLHDNYDNEPAGDWALSATPEGKMCCLGVLRFLGVPEGPKLGENTLLFGEPDDWERIEYGLSSKGQERLVEFNDDIGLTFPEIAERLLRAPFIYFTPEVATGVKEHFWTQ